MRPTLADSPFKFTRSAAAILTGASGPQVKKLGTQLLKKPALGTGHYLAYSFDDLVRLAVAKELLHVGVQVSSLHRHFAAIAPDWPRLRTPQARRDGAALVLIPESLGPNSRTGRAYLTTAREAVTWLQSKQTVVFIDVHALVEELERRTGERY